MMKSLQSPPCSVDADSKGTETRLEDENSILETLSTIKCSPSSSSSSTSTEPARAQPPSASSPKPLLVDGENSGPHISRNTAINWLLALLALTFAAIALAPAYRSQNISEKALSLAQWTALKDFINQCQQEVDTISGPLRPDCTQAIQHGLPAPPYINFVKRKWQDQSKQFASIGNTWIWVLWVSITIAPFCLVRLINRSLKTIPLGGDEEDCLDLTYHDSSQGQLGWGAATSKVLRGSSHKEASIHHPKQD